MRSEPGLDCANREEATPGAVRSRGKKPLKIMLLVEAHCTSLGIHENADAPALKRHRGGDAQDSSEKCRSDAESLAPSINTHTREEQNGEGRRRQTALRFAQILSSNRASNHRDETHDALTLNADMGGTRSLLELLLTGSLPEMLEGEAYEPCPRMRPRSRLEGAGGLSTSSSTRSKATEGSETSAESGSDRESEGGAAALKKDER